MPMPPIQKLAQLLLAKSSRMATAESCTGGLLAAQLTALPGASLWFECALITYSNAAKECFLNVSSTTLATAGAVSEGCVLEMLAGLFTNTQASVGVAISGIAGPDGGTKDKPVGTVWFAFGIKGQKHWPGGAAPRP